MNRLITRIILVLVVLGGGWLTYQASDIYKCNGPKSRAWLNNTIIRLDEAVSDNKTSKPLIQELSIYASASTITPTPDPDLFSWLNSPKDQEKLKDQLSKLANRAEQRYNNQQEEETPSCLVNLQEKVVTSFYYDWKFYDAAVYNNMQLVNSYGEKFNSNIDELIIELDRLSAEYNQ